MWLRNFSAFMFCVIVAVVVIEPSHLTIGSIYLLILHLLASGLALGALVHPSQLRWFLKLSAFLFCVFVAIVALGPSHLTVGGIYLLVLHLFALGLAFCVLALPSRIRSQARKLQQWARSTQSVAAAKRPKAPPPQRNELAAALASSRNAFLGVGLFKQLRSQARKLQQWARSTQSAAAVKRPKAPPPQRNELAAALASSRNAFLGVGLFSGMSNVLMLTGAFFMLQIYDRVLPSRSVPTLVSLAVLAFGLFIAQGLLDVIRARVLSRIGASLDEDLSGRVYDAVVRLPSRTPNRGEGLQPLRDLDSVRAFLSGQGPTALFDLPWCPIYLAIIFCFHVTLGLAALLGAAVLILLTLLTEVLTRRPIISASGFAASRNGMAEASRRNAEVITAMGMTRHLSARWIEINKNYMASNHQASDVAGGFGSISRTLRMMLQSAIIGIGAYLVIHGEATAGIIIAGSIMAARALAPVELAIAHWRGFVAARQGWQRLNVLFNMLPEHTAPMAIDAPTQTLSIKNAIAIPPGRQTAVVHDISFVLERGHGLGIIGPSGSGKSSLARLLVGAWEPARGTIRLDGAALSQWSPEDLGRHIGYLPQDVELLAGSVAQNISRFEPDPDPKTIMKAANAAGVHDLIVSLPDGYNTEVGDQGTAISVGQRQRIGLARALYGNPFVVVLDEPNSNLDAEGEDALRQAIFGVRERGGIIIVIAHRPSALAGVDKLLVMAKGRALQFGAKEEVLAKLARPVNQDANPLKVVRAPGKVAP